MLPSPDPFRLDRVHVTNVRASGPNHSEFTVILSDGTMIPWAEWIAFGPPRRGPA